MEKSVVMKIGALGIVFALFGVNSIQAASQNSLEYRANLELKNNENNSLLSTEGYTNLTIDQVWELIQDESNGIQYLIDVRTPGEFIDSRIYTPSFREKPRLFPVQFMQLEGLLLQYFMIRYANEEIILYCRSANRSFIATKILIDHGFSGTIYNMVGGINEWKLAELPTREGLF